MIPKTYSIFSLQVLLLIFALSACKPLDPKPNLSAGFIKLYSGVDYTISSQLILTKEGGYGMIGSGKTDANQDDIYVVKTDNKGNKIWDKYLGSAGNDTGYSIKEDAENNLVVLGVANPFGLDSTFIFLAKLDGKNGNIVWERQLSPNGKSIHAYDLKIASDGNYIIAGTEKYAPNLVQASIVKASSSNGDIIKIGPDNSAIYKVSNANLVANSVLEGDNQGYVWAAATNNDFKPGEASAGSFLVAKMNKSGNLFDRLDKTDPRVTNADGGNQALEMVNSAKMTEVADGYIIVGSSIKNGSFDSYLLKIDKNFVGKWYKTYGIEGNDYGYTVAATTDGGYVIAGRKDINFNGNLITGNTDVFVIKTDKDGNQLWEKEYGGEGAEYATDIVQTPDGGYAVLTSFSLITSPQNKLQMTLVKINSEGKIEN